MIFTWVIRVLFSSVKLFEHLSYHGLRNRSVISLHSEKKICNPLQQNMIKITVSHLLETKRNIVRLQKQLENCQCDHTTIRNKTETHHPSIHVQGDVFCIHNFPFGRKKIVSFLRLNTVRC